MSITANNKYLILLRVNNIGSIDIKEHITFTVWKHFSMQQSTIGKAMPFTNIKVSFLHYGCATVDLLQSCFFVLAGTITVHGASGP